MCGKWLGRSQSLLRTTKGLARRWKKAERKECHEHGDAGRLEKCDSQGCATCERHVMKRSTVSAADGCVVNAVA